jgi:hypothetical protein
MLKERIEMTKVSANGKIAILIPRVQLQNLNVEPIIWEVPEIIRY